MTIPNLISIFRLLCVPVIVWLLLIAEFQAAFWMFIVAGLSDGVDGALARYFDMGSKLGGYLDPTADKILLVSVYLTFGIQHMLPSWLVILVISRDVLIVGAVILSWLIARPVAMKPLLVSKANTAAQTVLIALLMGMLAFDTNFGQLLELNIFLVAALTIVSTIGYLVDWLAHLNDEAKSDPNAGDVVDDF